MDESTREHLRDAISWHEKQADYCERNDMPTAAKMHRDYAAAQAAQLMGKEND